MPLFAKVYIARHERYEAAEAYVNRLSPGQIEHLKETDGDFWMNINADGSAELFLIEDEG